jgi:hypothetical protein
MLKWFIYKVKFAWIYYAVLFYMMKTKRAVAKTKKAHPEWNIRDIEAEYQQGYFVLHAKREKLDSAYWEKKAYTAYIPIPPKSDVVHWDTDMFGRKVLTTHGINEVRKNIRAEAKDRDSLWMPRITALFATVAGLWAAWEATGGLRTWLTHLPK